MLNESTEETAVISNVTRVLLKHLTVTATLFDSRSPRVLRDANTRYT